MDWHWFFSLLTSERIIALATVGYLAVTVVMFLQIHRQGKILERQAGLQEAGFRQWVTTRDWKVSPEIDQDVLRLDFTFEIVNCTTFPLTIHRLDFKSRGILGEVSVPLTEPESQGYLIPPHEGRKMNHEVVLGEDLKNLFEHNGALPTPLDIGVAYTDCLERNCTQDIFLICTCYQDRPADFRFYVSSEQREKHAGQKRQNPNSDTTVRRDPWTR